jgi:hypothetical protein
MYVQGCGRWTTPDKNKNKVARIRGRANKNVMPVPSNQPSQFFDEGVKLISYCPLCESSYNPSQAKVLGEKEDSHLLHIQCGNCSNAIIALVLISTVGVSSVGMVTDLGFDEVNRYKDAPAVSTDDVIETHHLLRDEGRLFERLFA